MAYRFNPRSPLDANLRRIAGEQIDKAIRDLTDTQGDRNEGIHEARKRMKKLRGLLRLVRTGGTPTCSASAPAVRDAAYRALAVAARGRSRWSRAILARRRRCRALQRARRPPPPPRPRRRYQQQQDGEERPLGGLAGRAKVLGRLVPGCRSLSLPALLAEVSDYIAALEMQVRAMGQLTHDLAASASASASSSSAPTAAPSIAPP